MSYLLRLVLPDRPGMLGAVATALGEAGADILSLDVVERGPDGAVDDLLVELPPGGLADRLLSAAQSVPGVAVESLRPYRGAADLHRDLELVEALASSPADALRLLVDHAPGVFRAGWAVVAELAPDPALGAAGGRAVVVASSPAAPEVTGLALPHPSARAVHPDETWVPSSWVDLGVELAVAPVGSTDRCVLVGRPGGPSFRASEVLRLAHLAGIAATVSAPAAPAGHRP